MKRDGQLFPDLANQRLLIRFTALALSAGKKVNVASARARGEHAAVLDADPRELIDHRSDDTRCALRHPERSRGTRVGGGAPIVPPTRAGPSTTLGVTEGVASAATATSPTPAPCTPIPTNCDRRLRTRCSADCHPPSSARRCDRASR